MASATRPTTATARVSLPSASVHSSATAPISPAAGRVRHQATTIWLTTFQCTTPPRRPSPAPMIPPDTTCVVESENPKYEDERMVALDAVSAENPCGDWI